MSKKDKRNSNQAILNIITDKSLPSMEITYNSLIEELLKALENSMGTVELFDDEIINVRQDAMYAALKKKQTMLNKRMEEQKCNMDIVFEEAKHYFRDQLDAESSENRGQTQGVLDGIKEVKDRIMNKVFDVKNWSK